MKLFQYWGTNQLAARSFSFKPVLNVDNTFRPFVLWVGTQIEQILKVQGFNLGGDKNLLSFDLWSANPQVLWNLFILLTLLNFKDFYQFRILFSSPSVFWPSEVRNKSSLKRQAIPFYSSLDLDKIWRSEEFIRFAMSFVSFFMYGK